MVNTDLFQYQDSDHIVTPVILAILAAKKMTMCGHGHA
jgi:hypothetical protein